MLNIIFFRIFFPSTVTEWNNFSLTIHCPNCLDEKRALLDNLQNTGGNIHDKNDFPVSELLLF